LVLLILLLLMVVVAYEPAGRLLVIQSRMVLASPRVTPLAVPWRRQAQCSIPAEPDVRITSDDYAWLVRREPRDHNVWLAAAGGELYDTEEGGGHRKAEYRQQNALRRQYAERALQLSPNDRAAWATLLAVRLGEHGS